MRDLVEFEPSTALLEGRRYLDWLSDDCKILKDLSYEEKGMWLLKLQLRNKGKKSAFIPDYSDWYVLIDNNYPNGKIEFYPSKQNGIVRVFPHQSPHSLVEMEQDYFQSNICLEQFSPGLEGKLTDNSKLYNYTEKALKWIEQAANGNLLSENDFFEKVAYPIEDYNKKVLFSEDVNSFVTWNYFEDNRVGFVNFKSGEPNTEHQNFLYVTDYYVGLNGYKKAENRIISNTWGNYVIEKKSSEKKGIWIRLSQMPYLDPWEAPKNWPQLLTIFEKEGIDFSKDVMPFLNNLRDHMKHVMMLGFPISKRIGDKNSEMHWQALELPILSDFLTEERYLKGFRKDIAGFEMADMRKIFLKRSANLKWLNTTNWSSDNLVSRGNLPKSIKDMRILLVGAGALGAILSELLVRSGVTNLDIVDPDILEMGNLTRHSLSANDIGKFKARSMVNHLAKSFIHYSGQSFNMTIEKLIEKSEGIMNKYDIVIETTGSDKVLEMLACRNLDGLVVSISLGLSAKRMYIVMQHGTKLTLRTFKENIQEWLEKDQIDFSDIEYPRDGLGCWHPLFPARIDHLSLLTSSALSIIESDILLHKQSLTIIERGDLGTVSISKRKELSDGD